jgi:hypothetical protein
VQWHCHHRFEVTARRAILPVAAGFVLGAVTRRDVERGHV